MERENILGSDTRVWALGPSFNRPVIENEPHGSPLRDQWLTVRLTGAGLWVGKWSEAPVN